MKKSILIAMVSLFGLFIYTSYVVEVTSAGTTSPLVVSIENPYPKAGAQFGVAVDGIGDIDDDGIEDLAIGAPGAESVYLFSGVDQTYIRTIEDPDGLIGYRFGFAVRGVGDVNGDGVEDIAVGSPGPWGFLPIPCLFPPCPKPAEWGRAFVFSGATGELLLRLLPDTIEFFQFGSSVAPLGDANGDTILDIAVGAPVFLKYWGEVYAFSGLDGKQIWLTIEPEPSPGERQSIASLGAFLREVQDLDGDGRRDLLVAAHLADNDPNPDNETFGGMAYVVCSANGTILRTHANPSPADNDLYGAGPGSIGDQDGDGIEDYVFGEAGAAILHLFRGVNGDPIMSIPTPSGDSTDFFGWWTAGVDDKDGDGVSDFWVSAPKGGKVYLMNSLGDTLLQVADPSPLPSPDFNGFGRSIAVTGDLDDDGGLDLIIGKPKETVGAFYDAGAVFLVLGVCSNRPPVANAGSDQTVEQTSYQGASVTLDGSGSYDPDGDPLTCGWSWAGGFASGVKPTISLPLGITSVTLTVSDGELTDEDTLAITVVDTTPPSVNAGPDVTVEQETRAGTELTLTGMATDICDADLDYQWFERFLSLGMGPTLTHTFPLGIHVLTLNATDDSGNIGSDEVIVYVIDTRPPEISVTASPDVLRPPNHKMVDIVLTVEVYDVCDADPDIALTSVISNEADDARGGGDGHTINDIQNADLGSEDHTISLRAEKQGKGDGRIYTITYTATDDSGNSNTATTTVTVPHDQK